jgi:hypothetical protein
MTESTAKSRAERKAERKRLVEDARKGDSFEVTPFGRKRKTACPTAVVKLLSALTGAAVFVWHWIRGDRPAPATEPPATHLRKAA